MNVSRFRSLVLALTMLVGAAQAAPGPVFKHPDLAASLSARWNWAFQTAAGGPFAKGYWAGYSIRRKMSEHSFIGSWNWPPKAEEWTLAQILAGRRPAADPKADERSVREAAQRALDVIDGRTQPERIVDKDIAILLRFRPASGPVPVEIEVCDVESLFDPKGAPLLWLGPAGDPDSLAALDRFYSSPAGLEIKKEIVWAAGLHQDSGIALPFLERAAAPGAPEAVRQEAAEALGEQIAPRAVEVLRRLIGADSSIEVRKAAIDALASSTVPSALDALIETAEKSPDKALREEAVEGLAEKASARAVAALGRAVFNDQDTEVQKEAVAALADLPRGEALPALTSVARTHANPEVRKAAISALGEMGGPDAIAVLAELAGRRK
jgi:HEAT repeat protein